jgi:creatinine amidohydrolase
VSEHADAVCLKLAELTRDGCSAAAAAGAMVIVPMGATEQHGPHLPVGTDSLHVDHVAHEAAAAVNDRIPVLVAPALPYGYSAHHVDFGGTASISPETLIRTLLDVADSLAASGFSRIFLLNGHGGNHEIMNLAAREILQHSNVDVAAASWWLLSADAAIALGALKRGAMPGHAGAFESSLVLALRPDLVRSPRPRRKAAPGTINLRDPLLLGVRGAWRAIDGYTDSPADGRPEHGLDYLRAGVAAVAAAIERFNAAAGANRRADDLEP